MDREIIIAKLRDLLTDFLKARQVELVDISCRCEGRDLAVRLLVDYPEGGISIGECAALNRQIGLLLDEKNILQQQYILEVSSPGIDRPLKVRGDFLRCLNRKVRIFLNTPVDGRWEFDGIIKKIEGESVFIEDNGGRAIGVPIAKIAQAKQIMS